MAKPKTNKFTKDKDIIKTLDDPDYDKANGYNNEESEKDYDKKENKNNTKKNDNYNESFADEGESDTLSEQEQKELAIQVDREFRYCYGSSTEWIEKGYRNLKLYNNQKRDPSKVGDPLIFTVQQTVLASLYMDNLQVTFKGREEGDREVSSLLNDLAEYDFDLMDKDTIDYEYDWDTTFFGRGLLEFTHFDRDTLTPIPEVIDPLTFMHDPKATSVAGSKLGKGSMRFGGTPIEKTMWEIQGNRAYFNLNKFGNPKDLKNVDTEYSELLERASRARADAQGTTDNSIAEHQIGENKMNELLKWYTFFKGRRCVVYLAKNRSIIVRYHVLKTEEGKALSYFPIFDRPLYPNAHSWNATSIPDLLEDKQRFRSIIYNAMGDAIKADLYPMYVYNTNKIKNRADLDFAFNKHIPVDGDTAGAVTPLNKANINATTADYILQSLDAAAQKATATPEIQQGAMPDTQRTLGETELVASKSSTRYSLTAKVFGWSEKRFWQHWYYMYKNFFSDKIDEKTIRISGAYGDSWRKLTKENFISEIDPDIKVVSRDASEAQKIRQQVRFEKFFSTIITDPSVNGRYAQKKLAELNGMKPDEINRLMPETIDELMARDENTLLNDNKLPRIEDNQNHNVHLEMHALAAETNAKKGHIKAHKEALRLMREKPNLFPTADPNVFSQAGITPPGGAVANQQAGGGTAGVQVPQVNQQMSEAASGGSPNMPKQGLQ